jgi:hypothetical protein
MPEIKTKTIRNIEEKIQGLEESSLRRHILEAAKSFKTSWLELGRALYSVWRDKAFKEWGFASFETYTAKEIGIRKQTAMKLLKSYYFLEKEEPNYLEESYVSDAPAAGVPTYETVNLLRLAKGKKELDGTDYDRLKKEVFEKGKDYREIRRDLTTLIRQRDELEPQEAYQKRRSATVRRFLSTLKALKKEIEVSKLLPAPIIKEAERLIEKLESEVS